MASAIFNLLNPVPFGLFVAVMIFDFVFANTAEVLWVKSSAWLVSLGLIFAIVPRFINLGFVWFGKNRAVLLAEPGCCYHCACECVCAQPGLVCGDSRRPVAFRRDGRLDVNWTNRIGLAKYQFQGVRP